MGRGARFVSLVTGAVVDETALRYMFVKANADDEHVNAIEDDEQDFIAPDDDTGAVTSESDSESDSEPEDFDPFVSPVGRRKEPNTTGVNPYVRAAIAVEASPAHPPRPRRR
jgi:hypothetical protein